MNGAHLVLCAVSAAQRAAVTSKAIFLQCGLGLPRTGPSHQNERLSRRTARFVSIVGVVYHDCLHTSYVRYVEVHKS